MIGLIADSAAASPLIRYKADAVRARDFTPTSTGYNMHKDMKMAADLAQQTDASLPLTAAAMQCTMRWRRKG
jgi:3-hydroxyisobutyrate dehydrogenase/glyoxylate/succinic semialdehyde reductase